MWHEAHDTMSAIDDASDVPARAVGIAAISSFRSREITERDLPFALDSVEGFLVGEVGAILVRDRHRNLLARSIGACEGRVGSFHLQPDIAADVIKGGVPCERAG